MNTVDKKTQDRRQADIGNPFPGLRPFTMDESHLFFGREGQSEEVLRLLSEHRFVAVIGASGSGKSSLMYCGLVPTLYGGFITEAGSSWKVIITRPGNDPIDNLARTIYQAKIDTDPKVHEDLDMIRAIMSRGSSGLTEAIRVSDLHKEQNILLMIDQFEELFRYKASRKDETAYNVSEAFVKLLVTAVEQKDIPIYAVLTMRSDFIGECSQFQDLTGLINQSNYLIPQMTRENFRSAITGPVAVGGASIDPNLVQQLMNDVGDNPDQLPILQHALMRTWEYWEGQEDLSRPISLGDYEAVGTMSRALSEHADEAYEELDEKEKQICESMFKTLTERGGDNRGIRRPTRIEVIAHIAKAEVEDVIRVIEHFRAPGRSFLLPAAHVPLDKDSVIDISHESLMRVWNRLSNWVEEEDDAVQMYTRLAEAAEMYQQGKTSLWRPPDLQLALNWKTKQKPTLTWAERYNPAFERAMVFLETSDKEFKAEEENKIKLQKRQLRRTRIFAIVLGTAAIISLGAFIYGEMQRREAEENRLQAEANSEEAERERTRAEEQAEIAEQRRQEAEQQRLLAEVRREEANEQRLLAEQNANEAQRQSIIAQRNARRAQQQQRIAEENEEEANKQKVLAEEASDEAFRGRMLSIAQSMAVKSLQIEDKELKALLAYQAYKFNKEYQGMEHHTDIYSGLYSSLKSLKDPSYNVYKGHTDAVRSIDFAPGSRTFYTAGSDGRLLRWSLNDTSRQYELVINNSRVNRVIDVSDDGQWLACGTDGLGIQLFRLNGKASEPAYFEAHRNQVRDLVFHPDNKSMLSAGVDGSVLLWTLQSGKQEKIGSFESEVQSIAVSREGDQIAIGLREGLILTLDLESRKADTLYRSNAKRILALAYNKDGSILASGELNGSVKVWNLDNSELIVDLPGHDTRITDIVFNEDSKLMASSSIDGKIYLWETENLNNQPVVMEDNGGFVFSLAFSPDGRSIVTGSNEENRLIARPTTTVQLAQMICGLIDRNMTRKEWETYAGADVPYEETCPSPRVIKVTKQE